MRSRAWGAAYEDVYTLTHVRGPSVILVMLAEELNKC